MAANTIGTDQDYATPSAWEAAIPADATEDYTGTCMVDEQYSGSFVIDVSNANDQTHTFKADSTVRHTYQYEGARITGSTGGSPAIVVNTKGILVEGMAFDKSSNSNTISTGTQGAGDVTYRNCIFRATAGTHVLRAANWTSGQNTSFESCALVSNGSSSVVIHAGWFSDARTGTLAFKNCSVWSNATNGTLYTNFGNGTVPDILLVNNKFLRTVSTGSFDDYHFISGGGAAAGSDFNASKDTSAPGTTVFTGQDGADHFASVTSGSEDLRINPSLEKATYIGTDALAGQQDAEGDTFAAGACDMGCDAESTGAVVAAPQPTTGLRLGLRLGL